MGCIPVLRTDTTTGLWLILCPTLRNWSQAGHPVHECPMAGATNFTNWVNSKTDIFFLMVLETRHLKSRCVWGCVPSEGSGEGQFLASLPRLSVARGPGLPWLVAASLHPHVGLGPPAPVCSSLHPPSTQVCVQTSLLQGPQCYGT